MPKKPKHAEESLTRFELERRYGQIWDTRQLARQFIVLAIISDQVVVRRKSDGVVGKLSLQNCPRYYYRFEESPSQGTGE